MVRRRLKMEKIKNEDYLRVACSKRKSILLEKASELSIVCDAHVALIMFSPAKNGKVTSFGLPDFHYLHDANTSFSPSPHFIPDYFGVSLKKNHILSLNDHFAEVTAEKEDEQEIKKMFRQIDRENESLEKWWSKSPKDLNLSEAIELKEAFEAMNKDVFDKINFHLSQMIPNYYVGSSSNVAPPFATMNETPGGYNNHSQIQDPVFEQAHSQLLQTTNPNYYVGSSSNVVPPFATMNETSGEYNNHSQIQDRVFEQAHSQLLQTTNPNYYVGSSSNVGPPFDANDHMPLFGFDSMNGGYNDHSQIQNQVFEQAHPQYHHGPHFY